MNFKLLYVVCLAFLMVNCNSDNDTSTILPIESTLIAKGELYGDGAEGIAEQNLIVSDADTWNALMAQMDSVNNVSNSFSEIDIDFNAYTVIAVFDQIRGNGGHTLDLDIIFTNANIVVMVSQNAPEGNATTVITQPFHIVKIDKTTKPIVFQ